MEQFITFIDETIEKMRAEEKMLAESHRKDEANLMRIKMNIYDVCKTVYGVCARMPAKKDMDKEEFQATGKWQGIARCGVVSQLDGDADTVQLYLKKLEELPKNWKESLEKAKIHGDVEKQVIEETKINALEEIKEKFLECVQNACECSENL